MCVRVAWLTLMWSMRDSPALKRDGELNEEAEDVEESFHRRRRVSEADTESVHVVYVAVSFDACEKVPLHSVDVFELSMCLIKHFLVALVGFLSLRMSFKLGEIVSYCYSMLCISPLSVAKNLRPVRIFQLRSKSFA